MSEDRDHLPRVSERIHAAVLAFAARTEHQPSWHMEDLRAAVAASVGHVAPASPDRVLRALRASGDLNYVVVNRRQSLYQWVPLREPEQMELSSWV